MKIGITGANGFIGESLSDELSRRGFLVKRFVREKVKASDNIFEINDPSSREQWKDKLLDVSCLIHCAGIAHELFKSDNFLENEYENINVKLPSLVLQEAVLQGVKRFIFISSSKVLGESTNEFAFKISDEPKPTGIYARSKLKAELALEELATKHGIELVIIRPSLVYGPGVGANFGNLIKLSLLGLPLPFKSLNNRRSFVFINNLNDLIINCVTNDRAKDKTFLVSDDQDIKIKDLISYISKYGKKRTRLVYFPRNLLKLVLSLIGRKKTAQALLSDFLLDIEYTKQELDWVPKFSIEHGLKETVSHFQKTRI